VPVLDPALRSVLLEAARATDGPVRDGGVYAETRGPRFETRAEIRLLADYADVVGMTAASEATLFQERGIAYALLGIVDNAAHGVGPEPLTVEAYEAQLALNTIRALAILEALTA
jgi:5'-methylthioadenosine phosphorylase